MREQPPFSPSTLQHLAPRVHLPRCVEGRCYLSVDKQNSGPLCPLTFIACHINNPAAPVKASAGCGRRAPPSQHARRSSQTDKCPFNRASSHLQPTMHCFFWGGRGGSHSGSCNISQLGTLGLALTRCGTHCTLLFTALSNCVMSCCSVPERSELVNNNVADGERPTMVWKP